MFVYLLSAHVCFLLNNEKKNNNNNKKKQGLEFNRPSLLAQMVKNL